MGEQHILVAQTPIAARKPLTAGLPLLARETLAARVAHAIRTLGYIGGLLPWLRTFVALSLAAFGQAKSNILALGESYK
ncbi:hypothetical protein GW17_00035439 [Ensete ventricosum]|nr:hypothetical protein GW17_00035439 [Ensete ventricosum]